MFTRAIDEDLELELLHVGLAEDLFREVDANREHLRQWLTWVDDTHQLLDTREFLRLSMAGWAEGRMIRCAIRWRGRVCGSVSVEGISRTIGRGEIGYWLSEDCQGHGIMTRAVRHLTALAFEDEDIFRLELHAAEANTRSWAIPQRLGWTLEGTKRKSIPVNGVRLDMRLYSLLRTDPSSTDNRSSHG